MINVIRCLEKQFLGPVWLEVKKITDIRLNSSASVEKIDNV